MEVCTLPGPTKSAVLSPGRSGRRPTLRNKRVEGQAAALRVGLESAPHADLRAADLVANNSPPRPSHRPYFPFEPWNHSSALHTHSRPAACKPPMCPALFGPLQPSLPRLVDGAPEDELLDWLLERPAAAGEGPPAYRVTPRPCRGLHALLWRHPLFSEIHEPAACSCGAQASRLHSPCAPSRPSQPASSARGARRCRLPRPPSCPAAPRS